MIGLTHFFLSCMMGVGVGDTANGGKRKERSPLVKMDVKKSKAMEDTEINRILGKKPIMKELATLGKFKISSFSQRDHPGRSEPDR